MLKKDFKIETSIYDENTIKYSISIFWDNFSIKFEQQKLIIEWETNEEIELIFNEFMNYVIAIQNESL